VNQNKRIVFKKIILPDHRCSPEMLKYYYSINPTCNSGTRADEGDSSCVGMTSWRIKH